MCYKGWTLENHGYLMAGDHNHAAWTTYTCVDSHPDTLAGGSAGKDGKLFYMVEATCNPLKCPPYIEGRELVCVVCSKNKTLIQVLLNFSALIFQVLLFKTVCVK